MPDKPMTPEEFAEHILKSLGFDLYLIGDVPGHLESDITARDESIRREAKREMRDAAAMVAVQAAWGECGPPRIKALILNLPIDTPPAAERAPEADPSLNDSLRKSDWKNDERLKDIAHDPSLVPDSVEIKPENVCPRCEGKKEIRICAVETGRSGFVMCPYCHGTGKRAPEVANGK